jgi:rhodanese-related sulfurtransferase
MPSLISRNELQQKLERQERFVLAEALPLPYFKKGHLPGAVQLSHERPETERLGPPDTEVVVYCASLSCQNSHLAAERLHALGFRDVKVYAGGKQDWADAGLPLVRS